MTDKPLPECLLEALDPTRPLALEDERETLLWIDRLQHVVAELFPVVLAQDGFRPSACGCCAGSQCQFQITVMDAYGNSQLRCGYLQWPREPKP